MQRKDILAVVCAVIAFPLLALAHQTGASVETTVGQYLVDVGYDPIDIQSGDRLVLDFDIKKLTDKTRVPYDYVWVRLEKGDRSILATGISRADVGPTTLLYQLPGDLSGEIVVQTRFQRGDEELADTSSKLTIRPTSNKLLSEPFLVAFLGFLAGLALMGVIWRVRG